MAKDALGHGSESRGAADALSQNHPKSSAPGAHPWQTRIGFYSLEAGQIGKQTGEPIIQSHSTPQAAMRALNSAIQGGGPANSGMRAQTFQLISPSGKHMALNEAYTHVFGEAPKFHSSGRSFYPRVRGMKVSK